MLRCVGRMLPTFLVLVNNSRALTMKLCSRTVTEEHLANPVVGDSFSERLSYFCWVLQVTPDCVIYADTLDCEKNYKGRVANADPETRCEIPIDLTLHKVSRVSFSTKYWIDFMKNVDVSGWLDSLQSIKSRALVDHTLVYQGCIPTLVFEGH